MTAVLVVSFLLQVLLTASVYSARRAHRKSEQRLRVRELESRYRHQQLAAACHELRSPVTAMQAAMDLAAAAKPTSEWDFAAADLAPDYGVETGEIIVRNLGRLNGLVDDVLSVSQAFEDAPEPSVFRPVDIGALVRAETRHHPSAHMTPSHRVGKIGTVPGDPRRLRWAVSNVLTNATEHCHRRIDVTLSNSALSDGRRAVAVRIADDGEGMRRPGSAGRPTTSPSGLGLRIVQSVISSHGGEILIEPISELGGAAFTLFFPTVGRRPDARMGGADELASLHQGANAAISGPPDATSAPSVATGGSMTSSAIRTG